MYELAKGSRIMPPTGYLHVVLSCRILVLHFACVHYHVPHGYILATSACAVVHDQYDAHFLPPAAVGNGSGNNVFEPAWDLLAVEGDRCRAVALRARLRGTSEPESQLPFAVATGGSSRRIV